MEELIKLLQACEINFDAQDHQIMCFSHIINICCQHVITAFTNVRLTDATGEFVSTHPWGLPDQHMFEEAVKWDPVALGCNIVQVLWNSVWAEVLLFYNLKLRSLVMRNILRMKETNGLSCYLPTHLPFKLLASHFSLWTTYIVLLMLLCKMKA